MILDILTLKRSEHVAKLRATSTDVTVFDRDLYDLTRNMIETMYAANGVGLAAPQIGVNKNIFVMRTEAGLADDTDEVRVLINPWTVIEAGDTYVEMEGCLSIPGINGTVRRFKEIGCIYWDAEGKRHGINLEGLQARIYQHEYDHLIGTLYIDRAENLYKPRKTA